MSISASARQRLTTGLWGGRKAGSFEGRAEVVVSPDATTISGVRRGYLRRSFKAPILPWEKKDDEQPITVAKTRRKKIPLPVVEAMRKYTNGDVPIETVREIAAPKLHIPELGTAILEIDDDDEDILWLM